MKTKFYSIGNITEQGNNATEAKEKAIVSAHQALSGDYCPRIITYRGHTLIIWRHGAIGWTYRIIYPNSTYEERISPMTSGYDSVEDVLSHACHHLAQNTWNGTEDDSDLLCKYPKAQADFHYWVKWQKSYKSLREQGLSDVEAYRLASSAA